MFSLLADKSKIINTNNYKNRNKQEWPTVVLILK